MLSALLLMDVVALAADGLYALGSYGPVDAVVVVGGLVGTGDVGRLDATGDVAPVDFGVETSLSARPLSLGYVVPGVAATLVDGGIETVAGGGEAGVVAADAAVAPKVPTAPAAVAPEVARFVDEGGVAGVRPATTAGCGVDWAEGSAGLAERAIVDESSDALSRLNHAKRGPD